MERTAASVSRLTLPDDVDRHVLAAATKTKANEIVTDNLRDFPGETLAAYEIEAVSADHFFAHTVPLAPTHAVTYLRKMRERFKKPDLGPDGLLHRMESRGLTEAASELPDHVERL